MDIFEILVAGGELAVHVYKNEENSYFIHPVNNKKSNAKFSKKMFDGLFSRGLLTLSSERIHEDFAVQRYVLRLPGEKS